MHRFRGGVTKILKKIALFFHAGDHALGAGGFRVLLNTTVLGLGIRDFIDAKP
jgi:hypothetical protein